MPVQPKGKKKQPITKPDKRLPYTKPHIMFAGRVTTRAGSALGENDESFEQFDLIDLLTGRK